MAEFPPLDDMPNHLGRAHVILDLLRGGGRFGAEYEIMPLPVPYLACDTILVALLSILSSTVAVKLYLSGVLVFTAWAGFRFLRAAGAPEMGWLALPLLLNWFVHSGFLSFLLSIPVVLLALEYRMRNADRWGNRHRIVFGLFATATWFVHLAAFGFLFAAVHFGKARRGRWWHVFRLEPGFLPGLAFYAWFSLLETGSSGALVYEGLKYKLLLFGNLFLGFDLLVDMLLFAAVVLGVLFAAKRLRRDRLAPAAGCVLLFLLMPRMAFGAYFADLRVLPFAAFYLLAAIRANPRRARLVGAGLLLVSTIWTASNYRREGVRIARMVHAADSLPRGATILPLAEPVRRGHVNPQHHVSTWLVSRRDAVAAYLFTKPFQHPLRRLRERYLPSEYWYRDPPERRPPLDFERIARDWEYVWVIGPDPVEEQLREHGALDTLDGELRIYRMRPK